MVLMILGKMLVMVVVLISNLHKDTMPLSSTIVVDTSLIDDNTDNNAENMCYVVDVCNCSLLPVEPDFPVPMEYDCPELERA